MGKPMACLGVVLALTASLAAAQRACADEAEAIAAMETRGGVGVRPEKAKGRPAIYVDLGLTKATDADLAHLKGLTNLQSLRLLATEVSDAGLLHLKGLANLQTLTLNLTKVGDAGL